MKVALVSLTLLVGCANGPSYPFCHGANSFPGLTLRPLRELPVGIVADLTRYKEPKLEGWYQGRSKAVVLLFVTVGAQRQYREITYNYSGSEYVLQQDWEIACNQD